MNLQYINIETLDGQTYYIVVNHIVSFFEYEGSNGFVTTTILTSGKDVYRTRERMRSIVERIDAL